MVCDPLGKRANTRGNSPAMVYVEMVEGDGLDVIVVAKGAGAT